MAKESTLAGKAPLVGIIMGSSSDWETLEHAAKTLEELGVPHETRVISAHRTPDLLFEYASSAEKRGIEVIIAGAGGAAHLPGMTASKTALPVLGVPVESTTLKGLDSLLSIAQMPGGVPVGTLRSFPSPRCPAAFPSARWQSARRVPLTRLCWQRPFSARSILKCERRTEDSAMGRPRACSRTRTRKLRLVR